MARNAAETKRSGTPRASASSACSEAKISGRTMKASAARLAAAISSRVSSAELSTPSTLPNSSAAACVAAEV